MSLIVNGFFVAPRNNSSPNASRFPAVQVQLAKPATGTVVNPFAQNQIAVIDTGSTISIIDKGLATDGDLVHLGQHKGYAVGQASTDDLYEVQICLKEIGFCVPLTAVARPLKEADRSYQVLLGADFLQHFELRLNYRPGLVRLEALGPGRSSFPP